VFLNRRELFGGAAAAAVIARAQTALSQPADLPSVQAEDRVFICNEDSNTLSVVDPRSNTRRDCRESDELRRRPSSAVPFRDGRGSSSPCSDDLANAITDAESSRVLA
jgi:hypothetical protein